MHRLVLSAVLFNIIDRFKIKHVVLSVMKQWLAANFTADTVIAKIRTSILTVHRLSAEMQQLHSSLLSLSPPCRSGGKRYTRMFGNLAHSVVKLSSCILYAFEFSNHWSLDQFDKLCYLRAILIGHWSSMRWDKLLLGCSAVFCPLFYSVLQTLLYYDNWKILDRSISWWWKAKRSCC